MTAGTFTVVIDPYEIVGTGVDPDASGRLTVRFQGGAKSAVVAGDLIVLDEFSRTGNLAPSVSAGYELELATDVASGGAPEDSAVGYELTWTNGDATARALFTGQPDGSTVTLSDLVETETIPVVAASGYALEAKGYRDQAEASAAQAAEIALGDADATLATALGNPASDTRVAADKVYGGTFRVTDPRFAGGAKFDSDGSTGDGNDDTAAIRACFDAAIAAGTSGLVHGGVAIELPTGIGRVTAPIEYRDCDVSLSISGAGGLQTFLYGDFIGAGEGILDLSNEDATSYSTKGHRIKGIGFLGNHVPGDPQGLVLKNATGHVVEDIDAPHDVTPGGEPLANACIVVTNDNNSRYMGVKSRAGFQPKAFDVDYQTVTLSFTSGSAVLTASSSVFTSAMVGKTIYVATGSDTGNHESWKATILSQTGTTATVDINAPSTASGVKFAVGHITGSITAASDQLVIDNIVGLTSDWIGMQVHVIGAALKSGGVSGVLSTRIESVSGNTITLEDVAGVTVASAVVLFAPAIFVGSFEGEDTAAGRQVNDSWWINTRSEGYQCTGIMCNDAHYAIFVNLKLHGPAEQRSDWAQAYYNGVFSEISGVSVEGVQTYYTILGPKFHISGSRGRLAMDNIELGTLWKNVPAFEIASAVSEFRLLPGRIYVTYDLTNFSSTYDLFSVPSGARGIVQGGQVFMRTKNKTLSKSRPMVSPGITAQEGGAIDIPDDTVYTFKPHGSTYGYLHFVGKATNADGIVKYRTSDDSAGAMTALRLGGSDVEVTTGTLVDGTTGGTDGKVAVSADTSGNLQIKNRRGTTLSIALFYGPYGF